MGISQFPAPTSGLSAARFPARIGAPFQIPAGLTLQNTVTSTTTFSAGALPAQVWVVMAGGGGGGSRDTGGGGGGGGTCIGWVDVPSAGITATIGAGGAAGVTPSGYYYGSPGGNTYFGSHVAFGGGGGMSTNDSWGSSSNGPLRQVFPRGPGAGYGSINLNTVASTTVAYPLIEGCAPFSYGNFVVNSAGSSSTLRTVEHFEVYGSNYNGGGAGGVTGSGISGNIASYGGNGLTGGGGTWDGNASTGRAGGNSSRNGGVSNTFTGGSGTVGGYGGGGAGLLANGGDGGVSSAAGVGGSGGGGGGGVASWPLNPGAGGAGCVLIYY